VNGMFMIDFALFFGALIFICLTLAGIRMELTKLREKFNANPKR
jgi:hypothetical protein